MLGPRSAKGPRPGPPTRSAAQDPASNEEVHPMPDFKQDNEESQ